MDNLDSNFSLEAYRGIYTVKTKVGLEIDVQNSQEFMDTVVRVAGDAACSAVVVDLSDVAFMDCSALDALVQARAEADRQSKAFVVDLVDARTPSVKRLMELAGLDKHLMILSGRAPN